MVYIHALGHCFCVSASIKGSRSPKQTRSGWEVRTLVYSDEDRCLHRRWSGSATSKPYTTGTYWRCSRHIDIHTGYSCRCAGTKMNKNYTDYGKHPQISKHSGLQHIGGGLGPLVNFKEIQSALYLCTLVLRVHTPAHTLSRPRLRMV